MTEVLGSKAGIPDGIAQKASDSGFITGTEGAVALIGQAGTTIAQPAPGEVVTISAAAGQRYVIAFDPEAAQVAVQGDNLILVFPGDARVVFENLGTAANQADPPVFEIAGQPIASAALFNQAQVLAEGTLETAAAPSAVQGTGETRYDDDTGQIIDLLDPQGVIPGVERLFPLINLFNLVAELDDSPLIVTADGVSLDEDDLPATDFDSIDAARSAFAPFFGDDFQFPGTDIVDGDPVDPIIVEGTIAVNFGFDRPGTLTFGPEAEAALMALNLTSSTFRSGAFPEGIPLSYARSPDNQVIVAFVDRDGDGEPNANDVPVFGVFLSPAVSDGVFSYTVILAGSINHPLTDNPGTPGVESAFEDPFSFALPFTATDVDGDSAIGTLQITLADDIPVIELFDPNFGNDNGGAPGALKIQEADLRHDARCDDPVNSQSDRDLIRGVSDSTGLTITFGADGPENDFDEQTEERAESVVLSLTGIRAIPASAEPGDSTPVNDGEIVYFTNDDSPIGAPVQTTLLSGGQTVFVARVDTFTWLGFVGPEGTVDPLVTPNGQERPSKSVVHVFQATLTALGPISAEGQQDWKLEFQLFEPLDHPDKDDRATPDSNESEYTLSGPEIVGALDSIRFDFTVTAIDDDGDAVSVPVTVEVDDHGPKVCQSQTEIVHDNAIFGTEGDDTFLGMDDQDEVFLALGGNDTLIGDSESTMPAGSLSNDTLQGDDDDDTVFGDRQNSLIAGNGGVGVIFVPGNKGADAIAGNDILFGGDGTGAPFIGALKADSGVDQPGNIDFADLQGQLVFDADGTQVFSLGDEVTYVWDGASHTLTGVASLGNPDARDVFTLQMTDVQNGAYVFTLLDTVDRPVAGTEGPVYLDLDFTVTDFDGDTARGTLKLRISDDGDDTLYGDAGQDLAGGNGGAGVVLGQGGAGGAAFGGNDTLDGGNDDDTLYGDAGGNLRGGSGGGGVAGGGGTGGDAFGGGDTLDGGDGDDRLYGDAGQDLFGGGGASAGLGGGGTGGAASGGDDTLKGVTGDDMLYGDAGRDIFGGNGGGGIAGGGGTGRDARAGNDVLDGGTGNDTLYGDAGRGMKGGKGGLGLAGGGGRGGAALGGIDTLVGGAGNDTLYGDAGEDLAGGDGGNGAAGGGGAGGAASGGNDSLSGGEGDDELHGDAGGNMTGGKGGQGGVGVGGAGGAVDGGHDILVGDLGIDLLYGDAKGEMRAGNGGFAIDTALGGAGGGVTGGNDTLYGGDNNDKIYGDAGADLIGGSGGGGGLVALGGAGGQAVGGNDTLHGGAGSDDLYGDAGGDLIGGTGGGAGVAVGGKGGDARGGNDILYGEDGDDRLFGDVGGIVVLDLGGNMIGGNGAGAGVGVGGSGGHAVGGNDILYGGAGNDMVYGDAGSDMRGGSGGGAGVAGGGRGGNARGGHDTLYGDAGNDRLYGDAGRDLKGGKGGDVFVLVAGGWAGDAVGGNDTLYGDAGDDTLYGDAGQHMTGGDAGFAVFAVGGRGGAARGGNDTLYGGAGNDKLVGDAGANMEGGIGGPGGAALGGTGGDVHGGDDTLYGGDGDDALYGDAFLNMAGNDGGDAEGLIEDVKGIPVLVPGFGGRGGDVHGGDDTLYGGAGNDILVGDAGWNMVGRTGGDAADAVSEGGRGGGAFGGDDTLYGGAGDDTLFGDAGRLIKEGVIGGHMFAGWGGAGGPAPTAGGAVHGGADTLYGDEGNDTLYGDASGHMEGGKGGKGGEAFFLDRGGPGGEVVGGNDTLYGGAGNDTLYGDAGGDLNGGNGGEASDFSVGSDGGDGGAARGGHDTLHGGAGDDSLYGDAGKLIKEGIGGYINGGDGGNAKGGAGGAGGAAIAGDDTLNGGAGNDWLYGDAEGPVTGGKGGNGFFLDLGGTGGDAVCGNDTLSGGVGDDMLFGDAGGDMIGGAAGNGILFTAGDGGGVRGGHDALYGGAGDDTLVGDAGGVLRAGPVGGDGSPGATIGGDDTLNGGEGDDALWGDAMGGLDGGIGGADTFVFRLAEDTGDDTIHDFEVSKDRLAFGDVLDTDSNMTIDIADLDAGGHAVASDGANITIAFADGDTVTIESVNIDFSVDTFAELDAAGVNLTFVA